MQTAWASEGRVTAIIGPSGIGKTFLWRSIAQSLDSDSPEPFYFKAPHELAFPLQPIRFFVTAIVDKLARDRDADDAAVLTQAIEEIAVSPPVRKQLYALLVPDRYPQSLDVDDVPMKGPTEQIVPLLHALLGGHPATIVIDDVQWIDTISIDLLSKIACTGRGIAVVLLGRTEAEGIPGIQAIEHRWLLEPLGREESAEMLSALLAKKDDRIAPPEFIDWAVAWAQGSPLALDEAARMFYQHHRFERYLREREERPPGGGVPSSLQQVSVDNAGEERIRDLPLHVRRFLLILSLISPPIDTRRKELIRQSIGEEFDAFLTIAIEGDILVADPADGSISFRHDQLERAVLETVDDSAAYRIAATVLDAEAAGGDEKATYVLARYIAIAVEEPDARNDVPGRRNAPIAQEVASTLTIERRIALLDGAASRMLETFAPREARRFVVAAEELFRRNPQVNCPISPRSFYEYGHTAAFLLDDGMAMSRYFTRLQGNANQREVSRLRELWITRCFDKMWITGAWRIGRIILADLGALPTGDAELQGAVDEARDALSYRLYRRVARAVQWDSSVSKRSDDEREPHLHDRIIGRTAIRMLLPTLSVAPDTTALFAWIILRNVERYRVSPETLLGLVYWSFSNDTDLPTRPSFRRIRRLGLSIVAAIESREEPWSQEVAMAAVYGAIIFTDWRRDIDGLGPRLYRLYKRALEVGSYDAAGHAISLYCQWILMSGFPLDYVYSTMERYRHHIAFFGQARTATSIIKYQQGAEVLLGRTVEPLRVSGSLIDEATIEKQLRDRTDSLALHGYFIVRILIAIYHDAPEEAHTAFVRLYDGIPLVSRFFDINAVFFYHGIAASRLGMIGCLDDDIRSLRMGYSRFAKGRRYRYLALQGERAYHAKDRRRARRRFRRAVEIAISRGYIHEAALIAERDGTIHDDEERLSLALGLYRRWGAARAESRVLEKVASLRRGKRFVVAEDASSDPPHADHNSPERILERTRSYFQLLLTTIPDALLLLDTRGRVLLRNSAAEEFVAGDGDEAEVLAEKVRTVIMPLIDRAIHRRQRLDVEREFDTRSLSLSVTPAVLQPGTGTESRNDLGEVALVIRDVTTARERDRQLVLADRMSSLGMLASTVAHEVSNPNHIVQLNAQVLQMQFEQHRPTVGGDGIDDALHNILDGARRIDAVVRSIVNYGRGGAEHQWTVIDPVALCRRVVSFTRLLVTRSNDGLVLRLKEPLPQTTAVAPLIEQALINLVKNAVEALGERSGEIAISVDARGPWLVFAICDQGPGFRRSMSDPTEAFVTSRGESGGVGLGLSIVRSIAENHGGRLVFTHDDRYATIAELLIPHDHAEGFHKEARNRSTDG